MEQYTSLSYLNLMSNNIEYKKLLKFVLIVTTEY